VDYPGTKSAIYHTGVQYDESFRFTEFNPNVAHGDTNATENTFGSALFALDGLHWWAQNGCSSIHFHSGLGGFHGAFYFDSNDNLQAYPLLYGCKAFDLGGHGKVVPITNVTGTDSVNLTAYSVGQYDSSGTCTNLFVTIINKSMSTWAADAAVSFTVGMPTGSSMHAMYLKQNQGYVTATNGVTLGGASIDGTGPWQGQWINKGILNYSYYNTTVTNLTAVVLRFSHQ
jgi:hypothetical protein